MSRTELTHPAPTTGLQKKPGQVFYDYPNSIGMDFTITLTDEHKRSLIAEIPREILLLIASFLDTRTIIFQLSLISRKTFFRCRGTDPLYEYAEKLALYQSRLFRYNPHVSATLSHDFCDSLNCYLPRNGRKEITSLSISPDGEMIVVGTQGGLFEICNGNGETTQHFNFGDEAIIASAFHPNGLWVAVGSVKRESQNDIKLMDVHSGEIINTFGKLATQAGAIAFNTDGSLIATQLTSGYIYIWNTNTGQVCFFEDHLLSEHQPFIFFNSKSNLIAHRHWSNGFLISDINSHRRVHHHDFGSCVSSFAFSSDEKRVVTGEGKTAWITNPRPIARTNEIIEFEPHPNPIKAVEFSADDKKIITVSFGNALNDGVIKIFDIETKHCQTTPITSDTMITTVSIQNGHILFGFENGAIKRFRFSPALALPVDAVEAATPSP